MKSKNRSWAIASMLIVLVFSAVSSMSAEAAPAEAAASKGRFDIVAPYIDENTYAVAFADLSRVDTKAIETTINDDVKAANLDADSAKVIAEGITGGRQAVDGWIASFTKAGGQQIYVVMSLVDLPYPPVIIVPLGEDADAGAIRRLFTPVPPAENPPAGSPIEDTWSLHAERIGSAIVIAPAAGLRRIHNQKPADRPDIAAALASVGDAPVAAVAALPADTRRVIEESMPKLPPELGGGATNALTRGLRWASIAIHLPPDASVKLTIRTRDAESAKALAPVVDTTFKSLARSMEQDQTVAGLLPVVKELTPAPSADHPEELVATLDKSAIQRLASQLPDQLLKARARAESLHSMNQMRQLLVGCVIYTDEHKGDWPDDLETAVKAAGLSPELLTNPAKPDAKPGFTYISPGKAAYIKDYASRMVMYEIDATGNRRNAGFADGHVQSVTEDEFQKYLKDAKDALANRPKP